MLFVVAGADVSPVPDLKYIEATNYKVFGGTIRLDLAPLTVVFGRNGSGKSALVRLPTLVSASLRPNADAEPGLPYQARGMRFGSSFLSFCHGGVSRPDGVGLKLGLGTQELEVQLGQKSNSPLQQPAQWIERWRLRSPRAELSYTWDWRTQKYVEAQLAQVVFRGLLPAQSDAKPPGVEAPVVEHLGPRRELGQSIFIPAEPKAIWDVGFAGTDTARVLASLFSFGREAIIDRVREELRDLLDIDLKLDSVKAAVPGTTLEARRVGRPGWFPMDELGTGLAHLLPVVVALVAAAEASDEDAPPALLTVEEPEAHLRPDVHARLADRFLSTVQRGRTRCLVETHSETLILRLQRRVAERPELASQIALVWIDDEGDSVTPRPLTIQPDGTIAGWPERWFDSAYEEVMELSRARLARSSP